MCGEEDESIGKYNIQPATGHLPIISLEAKNPTCQEEGHTSQTSCALCGEILVPSVTIPKSQHAYEEIDRVESTCTVDGYVLLECSVCHETLQIHEGTTNKHKDFDVDKICDDCGAHLIYSEADFYDIENDMAGTYVLMNDITLSRTTPLGLINGHENETNISQEHATPFTGSLTSNNTNRTISYSHINNTIDTFYIAPIYLNQGLIEGVNCNILDIDFAYEETNIGVDSVTSQSKIVAGLALINQGTIKECGCVDDTNLNLSFKMSSTDAFAGSRVEQFNYYYGGLAYINDSDGIIDQCFNSAYLSFNETASIHHNGRTEDSIKYDQNRRIWLSINSKIGSIAYTNNGSITSSSGSLKMNVSINGILVIVPEKTNILSSLLGDKISKGFGNIVFTTNIAAQQIAFSNNGKINNCYGEVINTASWSVSVAYSGRSQKYPERIRYGVSTNDEWFKYYGENDAPIINTIDLDDEIPEEEVDEGDGN